MTELKLDTEGRDLLKAGLLNTISSRAPINREQLLGYFLILMENCLSELIEDGYVLIEEAASRESHLDVFKVPLAH